MKTHQTRCSDFSVRCSTFGVVLTLLLLLPTAARTFAAVRCVDANSISPTPPYTNWVTAAHVIQDAVDAAAPGDEIAVTNCTYATGGRAVGTNLLVNRVAVDKPLTLRSVNGPQFTVIQGYQAPGTTNGDEAIRCVYLADGAILSGFTLTNGATRAVDDYPTYSETSGGGAWCESTDVLVTNCMLTSCSAYELGGGAYFGMLNDCRLTSNAAYLGGGASRSGLNNCALSHNSGTGGGGVHQAILRDCTLTGNSAEWAGGGAFLSLLDHCLVTGNSASTGGGVLVSMLTNCTVTSNSAESGGGAGDDPFGASSSLNNCILYFNSGGNYAEGTILNYCCTMPLPANGIGNITNTPLFMDYAGGNLRLQSNSPCINAGLNAYAPAATDLDGNPRIVSGTVDIGAYEFQGPGSMISYAWLQHYGLPTDGSVDATDPDGDGLNNWQEWRCQTDPTNALSVLRLLSAPRAGSEVTVTWQSVAGVSYCLERSANLLATPRFTPLATNLLGQSGRTTYLDINAAGLPHFFYRVSVP
jgi:hypothetical protein